MSWQPASRRPGASRRGFPARPARRSEAHVTRLCRHLGITAWIAWLVGPAVDLSVVGLLTGMRFLSLHGYADAQLARLQRMLRFCGLLTLALNTAGAIGHRQYGTALVDAVGPALLIGWSEVGPWMLRQIHAVCPPAAPREPQPPGRGGAAARPAARPCSPGRGNSTPRTARQPAGPSSTGTLENRVGSVLDADFRDSCAPQNSHKSAVRRGIPTGNPRTYRHTTAYSGTPASIKPKQLPSPQAGETA